MPNASVQSSVNRGISWPAPLGSVVVPMNDGSNTLCKRDVAGSQMLFTLTNVVFIVENVFVM